MSNYILKLTGANGVKDEIPFETFTEMVTVLADAIADPTVQSWTLYEHKVEGIKPLDWNHNER